MTFTTKAIVRTLILVISTAIVIPHCSHVHHGAPDSVTSNLTERSSPSGFEIHYMRGKNSHRFLVNAISGEIAIESYVDQALLNRSHIGATDYERLLKKVHDLAANTPTQESKKSPSLCRVRYHLTIQKGKSENHVSGCADPPLSASLGDLIREIEFVMVSSKREKDTTPPPVRQ